MFANGWKLSILLLFGMSCSAFAQEISIFDVRNTLALSDEEPTYKDYYLNAGSERGLREGMIITVIRKLALYDSYQNKSPGELEVQVGKVKLIHVQKGLAVARDYADISRVSHPLLDYDFVMVGDSLDLDSMTTESKQKKTAEQASPPPEQARRQGAAFAIDFASKAPAVEQPTVPVSTLQ